PGVQYDTTINDWHTCPNSGRINASNPCSEYMHVDDSACNLASLNLMKFRREDGTFDTEKFEHAVDLVLLAQEIVVSPSSYPTEEIGRNARAFRQLGLGYANLGALLMSNGLPYDSAEGRATAAAITALMTGRAYRKSAEIAAVVGPYQRYAENREPHNHVMRKHQAAAYDIPGDVASDELIAAARRSWDEAVALGDAYLQAWNLGIKALAIYRDGSKTAQALRTDAQKGKNKDEAAADGPQKPYRKRMPKERQSITHKFSIAGHEGYITAGMYDDG